MHWESLTFSRHVQLEGDLEIDSEQHLWNYMSPLDSKVVLVCWWGDGHVDHLFACCHCDLAMDQQKKMDEGVDVCSPK